MSATDLETRNLRLEVGERVLLESLTLRIRAGESWGILGANGSGKTTLLHSLAGLRAVQGGTVLLGGTPIGQTPRRRVAQQLGLLPQDHVDAFPATVLQTALTGRHPHLPAWAWEDAQDEALARAALHQLDLGELADRDIDSLSGGERRRLGFATLLTQDPTFLLLDEPTNHLDLRHQIQVLQLLRKQVQAQHKSLVMVLHDPNLASRFCDNILMLFGDGSHAVGAISELMHADRLAQLYGHPLVEVTQTPYPFWTPQ